MTTPSALLPVLLAYDGSPDAGRALEWAGHEALGTGRSVTVMTVEDVQLVPPPGVAGVVSSAPGTLDDARAALAGLGVQDVTLQHRVGRVAAELLDAAGSASCVVLGSRGHGAVGEAFLGSVSQHVARHATCPVVVVRQPRTPGARRIVVGVDGSPGSAVALAWAWPAAGAERTGETVSAIHAWHEHAPSTDVWSAVPRTLAEEEDRRLLLAESVAGVREDHPDVDLEPEAVGVDPATCLVGASSTASLLVVGSRGRGVVSGLLLGSVSQAVLHRAHCPVVVVR